MALLQNIEYQGDNRTFVWKSPIEDFSLGSSLTVNESHEALFFSNGQALDLFPPGRHTLTTQNIPMLGKAVNAVYGGETPFHCSVYFINKVEQMGIKWGTEQKVEYTDPKYPFPIQLGMNGDMSLKVNDSRKLILKLVATDGLLSQDALVANFRAFITNAIKSSFGPFMRENGGNIFEVDEKLGSYSSLLKEHLIPLFDEYGMELTQFVVSGVAKPEGDRNYERLRTLQYRQGLDVQEAALQQQLELIGAQTEAGKMDISSEALARKRAREGYTYQQERGFDVAQDVAQNEATGQFTNMGIGLGTMAGVGGAIGGVMGGAINGAVGDLNTQQAYQSQGLQVNQLPQESQPLQPPSSQEQVNSQQLINAEDPMAILEKVKGPLDKGLISQEQYDAKVAEVLGRM